jgi:hypothetical protein
MLRPPLSLSISSSSRICKRISKGLSSRGRKYPPARAFSSGSCCKSGKAQTARAGQGEIGFAGLHLGAQQRVHRVAGGLPPGTPNRPLRWARQSSPLPTLDYRAALQGAVALPGRRFSAHVQSFSYCFSLKYRLITGVKSLSTAAYPAAGGCLTQVLSAGLPLRRSSS